jgi:hypothetical protein
MEVGTAGEVVDLCVYDDPLRRTKEVEGREGRGVKSERVTER